VRYVLEGSVRKSADRIRITAQFIEAETGKHIWAERYDRNLQDIFAVQDEVAEGIVGALQSRLMDAEVRLAQRKPPDALDAWGCVVQAKFKLYAYRKQDLDQAEPFVRKAIEIDPEYAEAHAVLGHVLAWRSYNGWTEDWLKAARDAVSHCDKAMSLAPNDPSVLTQIGTATWTMGRFRKAVPILERAISLNPNSAVTCAILGVALACLGRCEEGIEHGKRAFKLSPKDPLEYMFETHLATCQYLAGDYQAARQATARALQTNSEFIYPLLIQAACCVRMGERDVARSLVAKVEKLGSAWAIDNLFRPRTDGTVWPRYTSAIREVMNREPRVPSPKG